jgi:GTP diphosphokinase / guanosine-3',5'-bis(diphosphate) 3'-diphosphatase
MTEFSQEEKNNIEKQFHEILASCPKCKKDDETIALVRKAFDIANKAHYGSRRKSGEPYILHPIEVAKIVSGEIGLGSKAVVCALLHDVVEDTDISVEDISDMFDPKIAQIIDGLTKIRGVLKTKAGQAENFKKMIFTLAEDVRVILIKIADRLHNMRTLDSMPHDKQLRIAEETQNLFVPLAHRLGFYNIKMELEDLCLKYQNPTVFNDITKKLKGSEKKRVHYLNRFCIPIMMTLDKSNIKFNITSRSKSIASIWKKIITKNVDFDNVYDVFAVRIVLLDVPREEEKTSCWSVYSTITDLYTPNPKRLRDWISTPKDNGYEALHTTVMGPDGNWVEVQIRTERMDEIAERGYAAHWKYKDIDGYEKNQLEIWMDRVRSSLSNPDVDALSFLDEFKLNLYSTDLFAFTPKGEMVRLPTGATVLDFAYEIHTQIGHHAIGAKINRQKTVALDYKIQSGDQVEIITTDNQSPQKEWLSFIITAKAKNSLQQVFKFDRKKNTLKGQKILHEHLIKNGLSDTPTVIDKLLYGYGIVDKEELQEKIGLQELDLSKIVEFATKKRSSKIVKFWKLQLGFSKEEDEEEENNPDIKIFHHTSNYTIADCCRPIPGDSVVAFKENKGYTIHNSKCPIAIELQTHIKAHKIKWISKSENAFLVSVHIEGVDRIGILNEITKVIADELNVNIRTVHIDTGESKFIGVFDLYINDLQHLNNLMMRLQKIKGMQKVNRIEVKK